MGYDLEPIDHPAAPSPGGFHFGAFGWPTLLEQVGWYFYARHTGPGFQMTLSDPRQGEHTYPLILSNDGFPVTREEALTLARCAENFVAYQRGLHQDIESGEVEKDPPQCARCNRAYPPYSRPIREDWLDQFERFAEWARKTNGFRIY